MLSNGFIAYDGPGTFRRRTISTGIINPIQAIVEVAFR
jgi:hypothetical protein